MQSTSESLLLKLQCSESSDHWNRFVELYTPLLFYWARKTGLQSHDSADLVQDVFEIVFRKLKYWEYDSQKSFRGWMRVITLNRHRELARRKKLPLEASGSVVQSIASQEWAESTWDLNYASQLISSAMDLMKNDFAPKTWSALQELLSSNRPATEIAAEKNISVWTLYSARTRIIQRLRTELEGLL